MRSVTAADWWAGERGSVTAEFAAVIPAVVLVLAACIAGLQVAGEQLRLQDAAADAARLLARADGSTAAAARLTAAIPGARLTVSHPGDLVCAGASARSRISIGVLLGVTIRASGCALDGGR